jgi:pterin-4a-carbinolamine dehydratase
LLTGGGWAMADGGRDAIVKKFSFNDFNEVRKWKMSPVSPFF